MSYLTEAESIRQLKAAGIRAGTRDLRRWISEQRVRDVWHLGSHTYIYEAEIEALIAEQRQV